MNPSCDEESQRDEEQNYYFTQNKLKSIGQEQDDKENVSLQNDETSKCNSPQQIINNEKEILLKEAEEVDQGLKSNNQQNNISNHSLNQQIVTEIDQGIQRQKCYDIDEQGNNSISDEKHGTIDTIYTKPEYSFQETELQSGDQQQGKDVEQKMEIQIIQSQNKPVQPLEGKKQLEKLENVSQINKVFDNSFSNEKVLKLENLQKQLNQGLEELELPSGESLENEIIQKNQQIQTLEKQNRIKLTLERKKSLEKLENLFKIYLDLNNHQDNEEGKNHDNLQKQLNEGLEEFELQSGNLIMGEIFQKKEEALSFQKQNRTRLASQAKKQLEKLENLFKIYLELKSIQGDEETRSIANLYKQLNKGLEELELESGNELENEVTKKKEEILTLEKQKKIKQAFQRKKSLEKLESLLKIHIDLNRNQSDQQEEKIIDLQKQLNQGLEEFELQSGDQLENEITQKKQQISNFESQNRTMQASKIQAELSKLEDLNSIYLKLNVSCGEKEKKMFDIQKQQNKVIKYVELQNVSFLSNQTENTNLVTINEQYNKIEEPNEHLEQQMPNEKQEDCILLNQRIQMKQLIKNQISLQEDIQQYPDSSEKQILLLLDQMITLLGNASISMNNQINIQKLSEQIEILQKQLQTEDLKFQIFNKPLNIPELKRLIKKTEETAQYIQDKDILLLLGTTGTGKSTTIHFLAGSQMKILELKLQNGKTLKYIGPVVEKIKDTNLKQVIVSPLCISETRFTTAVKINLKDLGMLKDEQLIICDTPGFCDTAGAEVDIANGIGMVKAIQGSRSVRPIILISSLSIGDRGEGIKKLVHILVGLIKKVEQYLNAFSYLYTKFDNKSIEDITTIIQNVYQSIELNSMESKDTQLADFLQNMVDNQGQIVNALNGNPSVYINKILKKKPIIHPEEVFEVSITEQSQEIIREQLNFHKQSIISALKRNDFILIKYKLDEMLYLINTLNLTKLNRIYEESMDCIKTKLNRNYENTIKQINQNLEKNNRLSLEDIRDYQRCFDECSQIDKIREDHKGIETLSSDSFIQNLNRIFEETKKGLNQNSIKEYRNKFENLKLLAEQFPQLNEQYFNLQQKILEIQGKLINKAYQDLKNKNYKLFSSSLSLVKQQISYYDNYFDNKKLKIQYNEVIQSLVNQLNQIINDAEPFLKNEITQDSSNKIKGINNY